VYAAESWTTKKLAGTKQGYLKYGAGEKHFEYHNNRTNTESPNWVGMNKILKDNKLRVLQGGCMMLYVIEYFAKSLRITEGHSK